MPIDRHSDSSALFAQPAARRHAQQMREQAASFAADLAIARWSGAPVAPAMAGRADWLRQAQEGLQQWLTAGGFAQHEDDNMQSAAAVATPASLPCPGSRPLFYTLFRQARSTAA